MTDNTEREDFQDFTIAETQLWGKNIGLPFSDFPQVFRAIGTQMTFALAQETPVSWYVAFTAGEPEKWTPPEVIDADGNKKLLTWSETMSVMLGARDILVATNLIEWCVDVLDNKDLADGVEVRRAVVDELQKEVKSAGDWDAWVCHFAYVMYYREAKNKGGSPNAWDDYCKDTPMSEAKSVGSEGFMAWLNSKVPLDDEEFDGDNPLGSISESETSVPTAGV